MTQFASHISDYPRNTIIALGYSLILCQIINRQTQESSTHMPQSFTFSEKGIKVHVTKSQNSFKFSLIMEDSLQMFEREDVEFKRISLDTVKAAFDRHNKTIQYEIMETGDEKELILSFLVKLDFLPAFGEQVTLKRIQKGKGDLKRLQFLEIQNQIQNLENQIVEQQTTQGFHYENQQGNYKAITNDELDKVTLKEGVYLIEISGSVMTSAMYNGEEEYDQYGNYNEPPYDGSQNFNLIASLQIQGEQQQKRCQKIFAKDCYDYPFAFTFRIDAKEKESEVVIKICHENKKSLVLGQAVTNVTPVSEFL